MIENRNLVEFRRDLDELWRK